MRRGAPIDLEHLDARAWAELDRVLEVVLELPPDAVEVALERLCGANEELKARARTVLEADRAGAAGLLSKSALELTGDPIGAWPLHESSKPRHLIRRRFLDLFRHLMRRK